MEAQRYSALERQPALFVDCHNISPTFAHFFSADLSFLGDGQVGNLAMNRKMLAHVEWKLLPREGFDISQGCGELAVKTGDVTS